MIPKAQRLTKADFLKRPLRRTSFAFGSIQYLDGSPKAAVIVSKKICPRATDRNRLRRRLYAILRPHFDSGRIKASVRIYPNKKAVSVTYQDLKRELEKALGA